MLDIYHIHILCQILSALSVRMLYLEFENSNTSKGEDTESDNDFERSQGGGGGGWRVWTTNYLAQFMGGF